MSSPLSPERLEEMVSDPYYQDDQVALYHGDCLEVLSSDELGYDYSLGYGTSRTFPDCSVDAVVTDPPYGLEFMGREWDSFKPADAKIRTRVDQRTNGAAKSVVSVPEAYRAGEPFQRWCTAWAAECLRVLKPGGHLVAFGGSRTWHRLAAGIEDAGFEVRDSIAWLYGSGFPKSLDVSKAIDRAAGELAPEGTAFTVAGAYRDRMQTTAPSRGYVPPAPVTDAAKQWQGWGTALKPAFEPIVVARKPLSGTVAANVLEHGTGALNIDVCRIATTDKLGGGANTAMTVETRQEGWGRPWMENDETRNAAAARSRDNTARAEELGRWPTNVVLDEDQAAELDQQSGVLKSGLFTGKRSSDKTRGVYGAFKGDPDRETETYGDSGGASRFFPVFRYEAKAPGSERPTVDGIAHPTVKPLNLMRWLVRLVTPPGGTVLEPFAGSGTTAEACIHEHMRCIAIEREADYLPLITARLTKPIEVGFDFGEGA